jgi:type I restriction enzyme, R subunit
MPGQHTERAFETYVSEILQTKAGWTASDKVGWDQDLALFPSEILAFLKDTQPKLCDEMFSLHGANLEPLLISTLAKELDTKGTLHIIRYGFKFYGKTFQMAYFKPSHGLNQETLNLYAKNRLTVTRQVPCHPKNNDTVDLLFSINGLPIATCELKNPSTGQTWRNAIKQYEEDRDPTAPLFKFKTRSLVHFAADPDQVYMTTRLAKKGTRFLPLNRGSHPGEIQCGAGNPQHPSGYRTGYFWEEVLQRDSFLDLVGNFLFVEKKEEKVVDKDGRARREIKETLVFPRYHQLDSVRKLVHVSQTETVGENYLIQHSAGSGKTNSISWLSHRLASLHTAGDERVFDCVIVITDRRSLDQHLQEAVYQIEHAQGVVKAIDQDSKQLAEALVDGTKVVITTLQKFPFVLSGLLRLAGAENLDQVDDETRSKAREWQQAISHRKYALIIDEAHSSQSGDAAREMKKLLGRSSLEDDEDFDWEDGLNEAMRSMGRQKNLSIFAFTATPKGKTLELFGRPGPRGKPEAFHTYSMRQAIEEKFILDVLTNYTTYKTFYRFVKQAAEDPEVKKKEAVKVIARMALMHPTNVEQKVAVMVEHFVANVRHRIGGKAKAMVVTYSRLQAVRYKLAFDRYINEKGYKDIHALVAFSGTVHDPETEIDYTEPGMNLDIVTQKPISESNLPERFASSDYQVLIAANKYQTGFDQPLLHTMYVDKRLDSVQAVQTLSRLNRTAPGKEEAFILDFVNEPQEIHDAFKPYYDTTLLADTSDPQQMEMLKHELDQTQVYHWSEVEAFAKIFYKPVKQQAASDHAEMERCLQPASDRFRAIEDPEDQKSFRDKLGGFVRLYAFLGQIIPYGDPELEMFFTFAKLLVRKLHVGNETEHLDLQDDVSLQYYRLQRISSGAIDLTGGEAGTVKSPTDVGTGKATDERTPLSSVITVLNDRFGTDFTDEDRLFLEQIKEKASKDQQVIETALANPKDKFKIGIRKLIEGLMIQRLEENGKIVTRYVEDQDFQNVAFDGLADEIFDSVLAGRS